MTTVEAAAAAGDDALKFDPWFDSTPLPPDRGKDDDELDAEVLPSITPIANSELRAVVAKENPALFFPGLAPETGVETFRSDDIDTFSAESYSEFWYTWRIPLSDTTDRGLRDKRDGFGLTMSIGADFDVMSLSKKSALEIFLICSRRGVDGGDEIGSWVFGKCLLVLLCT